MRYNLIFICSRFSSKLPSAPRVCSLTGKRASKSLLGLLLHAPFPLAQPGRPLASNTAGPEHCPRQLASGPGGRPPASCSPSRQRVKAVPSRHARSSLPVSEHACPPEAQVSLPAAIRASRAPSPPRPRCQALGRPAAPPLLSSPPPAFLSRWAARCPLPRPTPPAACPPHRPSPSSRKATQTPQRCAGGQARCSLPATLACPSLLVPHQSFAQLFLLPEQPLLNFSWLFSLISSSACLSPPSKRPSYCRHLKGAGAAAPLSPLGSRVPASLDAGSATGAGLASPPLRGVPAPGTGLAQGRGRAATSRWKSHPWDPFAFSWTLHLECSQQTE